MKPVQISDLQEIEFLSQLTANPFSAFPVFACVAARMDLEKDSYHYELRIQNQGSWQTIAQLEKPGVLLFLDADSLLLSHVKSKHPSYEQNGTVFSIYSLSDGEIREAFTIPMKTSKCQRLGETQLVFLTEIEAKTEAESDFYSEGVDAKVVVMEELPYCANGRGWISRKRNQLWKFDWVTQVCQPITDPCFQTGSFYSCSENHQVLFTGMTYQNKASQCEGLYRYDASKQSRTTLIEEGVFRRMKEPRWIGETIVFAATDGKRYGKNEALNFYTLDSDTGKCKLLKALDHPLGSSVVSDCRLSSGDPVQIVQDHLVFTMTVGWDTSLFRLDLSGELTQLYQFQGSIDDFVVTQNQIVMIAQQKGGLQQGLRIDLSGSKLETVIENQLLLQKKEVAQPRRFSFPSQNRMIDGWVLEPTHYDPARQYPAVLEIHGGPNTAYGEVFHHEMQVLAGAGYFVLYCNPVGSVGRGDEFADIRGRYGSEDAQNLIDFVNEAVKRYPAIDSQRIAVCGGSYGGFMVNWLIGHTSRFVCAVSQRSIANFMTIYGLSDFGYYFVRDQLAADPLTETGQEAIWRQSPLRYASQVQTPTLFLHSDRDYRCTLSEGLQMFTALKDRGIPARMVCFQGENHELSRSGKPQARLRRLREILNWLDRWCKPEKGEA